MTEFWAAVGKMQDKPKFVKYDGELILPNFYEQIPVPNYDILVC